MNLHFDKTNYMRLAILLFGLALVAVVGTLTAPAQGGKQAGLATSAPAPSSPGEFISLMPAGVVPGNAGNSPKAPGSATNGQRTPNGMIVGHSYKNDTSPPIRSIPPVPHKIGPPREDNENPE